tara:strand:+ start:2244 stop:2372 length:129 start_codon:yes stop_codon:yes gene_type:complete
MTKERTRKAIGILIGFGGVIVIFGVPTYDTEFGLLAPPSGLC